MKTIKRYMRHRLGVVGAAILISFGIAAVFAPFVAPHDPNDIDTSRLPAPGRPAPPSRQYLWGTDDLGRDYLSRAIFGARISMSVGFVSMGIATVIGTIVGAASGYFGGRVDKIIMRIVDILLCFPTFFLILTVQATLKPSLYNVMIIIGVTGWMHIARLVRAEVLSLREREFVESAKVIGLSSARIIFKHVLPNALGPVIVSATLGIPGAILTESGLSFLGLGVQPPHSSWGNMLTKAQVYMQTAPWVVFYPGLMISLTVLSFNFVGDALRDALDPRTEVKS